MLLCNIGPPESPRDLQVGAIGTTNASLTWMTGFNYGQFQNFIILLNNGDNSTGNLIYVLITIYSEVRNILVDNKSIIFKLIGESLSTKNIEKLQQKLNWYFE